MGRGGGGGGSPRERRLAIYARVSTGKQEAHHQLPQLHDWAERMGYTVVMEEVETVSGRRHVRPGMDRIVRAAKGRRIHAVAVTKLDRWGRSMQNLVNTVGIILDNHVAFHAIDQGINLDKREPGTMLQFNIMSAIAEWEADMISTRTREGMAARKAAGTLKGPVGGRPIPCFDCGVVSWKKRSARRKGLRVRICAPSCDKPLLHAPGWEPEGVQPNGFPVAQEAPVAVEASQ